MWPDFYRFGPQLEHKLEFDFRGFAFRAPHFGSLLHHPFSMFVNQQIELFAFLILKDQTFDQVSLNCGFLVCPASL